MLAFSIVAASLCLRLPAAPANAEDALFSAPLEILLRAVRQDDRIPVTIVMTTQVSRASLDALRAHPRTSARREAVVALLKGRAAIDQVDVLKFLERERAAGRVVGEVRPLWIRSVIRATVAPKTIVSLARRPDVQRISFDQPLGHEVFPVDREIAPISGTGGGGEGAPPIDCGVELIGAPDVWAMGVTGEGVVVGVIDTGCCTTHPDLANHIWQNPGEIASNGIDDDANGYVDDLAGWNFQSNNADISDLDSHGTHVAGSVVGDGTGGTVSGMAPGAQVMVLKFWNSFGGESSVWEAMQYGVDNGADILTASLGWPHTFSPDRATWRTVCENAIAAGVIVVYAAGNLGTSLPPPDGVTTPGDVPSVITCGAVDCADGAAWFSGRGPVSWSTIAPWFDHPYPPGLRKPTICATGVDTFSTALCSSYAVMSGTSMATPHVSGTVALMLEANPSLDQAAVAEALETSAVDLGPAGPDNIHGAGRIDARAAVIAVLPAGPDLDLDGDVDFSDLLALLASWGACPVVGVCAADFDDDGVVGFSDLLTLLAAWS